MLVPDYFLLMMLRQRQKAIKKEGIEVKKIHIMNTHVSVFNLFYLLIFLKNMVNPGSKRFSWPCLTPFISTMHAVTAFNTVISCIAALFAGVQVSCHTLSRSI